MFTTKEKGSGFGLAIVYGIVKQHRGYIDVVSIPGKGSIFYIYLPVITGNSAEALLKIIDNNKKESLPALGGEIVIIDDDANIGSLYKESLHLAGLHAVTFTNAEEMFDYIRTHAVTVKLILSDVRMPGFRVNRCWNIKQHYPTIPVVMISGYCDEEMRELLIKKGAAMYGKRCIKLMRLLKG